MLYVPEFKGTYSADNIPLFEKKTNFSIIVNLSNMNEKGSHFIAIKRRAAESVVMYYNPFGGKCENKNILSFMSQYTRNYNYSLLQVQSYLSEMCGFFCAGYLISDHLNFKINKYHQIYNFQDLLLNDAIVTKFIVKHLDKAINNKL